MRFGLPVVGGMISPHFGHCEHFALIDVDDATKKIIKKELVTSPPHQPGMLPGWLAERNVSTVIAGGMGGNAQMLFQQKGINVVVGAAEIDPEIAVSQYLSGSLSAGNNTCDH